MIFKNEENLKYPPLTHTLFLNERKKTKQTPWFVDKIHAISIQFAALRRDWSPPLSDCGGVV